MSDPTDTWEWFTASLPGGNDSGFIYSAASDGDSWVGVADVFDGSTRSIAVALADSAGDSWELTTPFSTPTDGYLTNIAYGGGNWVAVGGIITGSGETIIASTDNPNGSWEVNTYAWGAAASDVVYGDGTWALVTSNGKVYTATDPAGTWTLAHDFSANANTGRLARIAYDSGTWAIAYRRSTSPYDIYVYSATDPSGTWTARGTISGIYDGPCGMGKTPGGWFIRLEEAVATKAALADAAWTVTTGLPAYSVVAPGPGFAYGDGYYVALSNSAFGSTILIKYGTEITGPFTLVDSTETAGGGMFLFGGPFYNGEDWVVTGDRGYDDEPGVIAPPSAAGAGWGVLL